MTGIWAMLEELVYQSFLLRLWRVQQNGENTWRASLENTSTGQKQYFSRLEALCEFLHTFGSAVENETGNHQQD